MIHKGSLNMYCKVVPVHLKASNQLHNLATIDLEKCPTPAEYEKAG